MKLGDLDYDLGIMHVLYGLAFALGFQELAQSLEKLASGNMPINSTLEIGLFITNCAIIFIGLRLFWAIGNLRRFVNTQKQPLTQSLQIEIVTLHFPIIVFQSFAFYLLCAQLSVALSNLAGTLELNLNRVIYFASSLLLLNSSWLFVLKRGVPKSNPERLWFYNNFGVAIVVLIFALLTKIDDLLKVLEVSLLLAANSLIDLGFTSKWYLQSLSKR